MLLRMLLAIIVCLWGINLSSYEGSLELTFSKTRIINNLDWSRTYNFGLHKDFRLGFIEAGSDNYCFAGNITESSKLLYERNWYYESSFYANVINETRFSETRLGFKWKISYEKYNNSISMFLDNKFIIGPVYIPSYWHYELWDEAGIGAQYFWYGFGINPFLYNGAKFKLKADVSLRTHYTNGKYLTQQYIYLKMRGGLTGVSSSSGLVGYYGIYYGKIFVDFGRVMDNQLLTIGKLPEHNWNISLTFGVKI